MYVRACVYVRARVCVCVCVCTDKNFARPTRKFYLVSGIEDGRRRGTNGC